MLTKALAVAGVLALTVSMSPGAASTVGSAAASTGYSGITQSSGSQRAGIPVPDQQRLDPPSVRPVNDASGIKIYPRRARGFLGVMIYGPRLLPSRHFNASAVYLQTRGDRRPDYRIVHNLRVDGDGHVGKYVARIRNWGSDGVRVDCPRLSVEWHVNQRYVMYWIPRACINRRGDVRINAETWDYYRPRGGEPTKIRVDGVPRYRTLTSWY
jgi:hypothetical protein